MGRRWVANASPLIALGRISQLDLVLDLSEELVVPVGVAQEVARGPADDPARTWLEKNAGLLVRELKSVSHAVAAWDLGLGESHVVTWAYEHRGYEAILDDRAARTCARALGIPVRGTIGVILVAKKEGRIPSVRPIFDGLVSAGFRIDPELLAAATKLVGE